MSLVDPHAELMKRCREMGDRDLIKELKFMVDREKRNLAALLVHLAEYDRRKLYQDDGYHSLFLYCSKALGYDENTAFRLITACRVLRHYPATCAMVSAGELTLTAILVLSPVLTDENHERLLKSAKGKSRREIETIAAGESPLPARSDFIRRHPPSYPEWPAIPRSTPPSPEAGEIGPLSAPAAASEPAGAPPTSDENREWQAVIPISLERVRIGFDAAIVVLQLLERARQILRHKYPEGRVEDIMREALELFLEKKDPQKRLALPTAVTAESRADLAATVGPLEPRFLRDWKAGRYIPAGVKRAVWQRDEGRCAHRFEDGSVCGGRDGLEFDHIRPFAKGGRSEHPRNVRLLCRLHNGMAAEASYGVPLEKAPELSAVPPPAV